MYFNGLWFIACQHLNQSARVNVVLEQAARHLAQADAGDGCQDHGLAIADLMCGRWRVANGFLIFIDSPGEWLAPSMADDAMVTIQIFQGVRYAKTGQITRRGANSPALSRKPASNKAAGILEFSKTNQQVDPLFNRIDQVVRKSHIQLQRGILVSDLK